MIEIQETTGLLEWAHRVKWNINQEIVEDGGGLPEFATLVEPHRFAVGFDPDSDDETNRLWVRMQIGTRLTPILAQTECWAAETMGRWSNVCSAERLDGE
jgi:hypothetical protein